MVIHGTDDQVVGWSHGLEIHDTAPITVEPLWVEGAGHNDVELYAPFTRRFKRLLQYELPRIQGHIVDKGVDASSDCSVEGENLRTLNLSLPKTVDQQTSPFCKAA